MHYWEITGVCIDRLNEAFDIKMISPENKDCVNLRFYGVKHLYPSDFLQNVILDVIVFNDETESKYFNWCCNVLGINIPDGISDIGKSMPGMSTTGPLPLNASDLATGAVVAETLE